MKGSFVTAAVVVVAPPPPPNDTFVRYAAILNGSGCAPGTATLATFSSAYFCSIVATTPNLSCTSYNGSSIKETCFAFSSLTANLDSDFGRKYVVLESFRDASCSLDTLIGGTAVTSTASCITAPGTSVLKQSLSAVVDGTKRGIRYYNDSSSCTLYFTSIVCFKKKTIY